MNLNFLRKKESAFVYMFAKHVFFKSPQKVFGNAFIFLAQSDWMLSKKFCRNFFIFSDDLAFKQWILRIGPCTTWKSQKAKRYKAQWCIVATSVTPVASKMTETNHCRITACTASAGACFANFEIMPLCSPWAEISFAG